MIPLLRQFLVPRFEKRKQRSSRGTFPLGFVNGCAVPAIALTIGRKLETEPVEKVLAPYQRHIPEARNPALIRFDRKLVFQLIEQTHTLGIVGEVLYQGLISREFHRRTDEKDGFALQSAHCNFVNGADAVDVCRAVSDDEVGGINHAKVDVQRLPIMTRQLRALLW